jgi:branched-chain amino acid transport system permease protein
MIRGAGTALRGTVLLAVPLLLVALWGTTAASPSGQRVVVNFLITLILVLGLQAFSGNSGIVSFGHVGFMGVGAYLAGFLTIPVAIKGFAFAGLPSVLRNAELGFVPSVLLAGLAAAAVAAVVGLVLTRMEEGAMAMATIALLVMFYVVANAAESWTRGASGLYSIPQHVGVWSALLTTIIVAFVVRLYRDSERGLKLRSSRDDALAAGALGVDVKRRRLWAWILSGAVMGIGGALFAEYNLAFDPSSFYFDETFSLLAVLIIGGPATVSGAVVGAAVVTVATQVLQRFENGDGLGPLHFGAIPGLTDILLALLILVLLRWRPNGIVSPRELDETLAASRG